MKTLYRVHYADDEDYRKFVNRAGSSATTHYGDLFKLMVDIRSHDGTKCVIRFPENDTPLVMIGSSASEM